MLWSEDLTGSTGRVSETPKKEAGMADRHCAPVQLSRCHFCRCATGPLLFYMVLKSLKMAAQLNQSTKNCDPLNILQFANACASSRTQEARFTMLKRFQVSSVPIKTFYFRTSPIHSLKEPTSQVRHVFVAAHHSFYCQKIRPFRDSKSFYNHRMAAVLPELEI